MTKKPRKDSARTDEVIIDGSITEAEWDLLEALWDRGRASAPEIARDLEDSRGWAYSTVKTQLDRMAQKGLVHARRARNVWEYEPAVEQEEAQRSAWRRFVGAAFGGALDPALRFIAQDARLTRRQRDALRRMLEEEK